MIWTGYRKVTYELYLPDPTPAFGNRLRSAMWPSNALINHLFLPWTFRCRPQTHKTAYTISIVQMCVSPPDWLLFSCEFFQLRLLCRLLFLEHFIKRFSGTKPYPEPSIDWFFIRRSATIQAGPLPTRFSQYVSALYAGPWNPLTVKIWRILLMGQWGHTPKGSVNVGLSTLGGLHTKDLCGVRHGCPSGEAWLDRGQRP